MPLAYCLGDLPAVSAISPLAKLPALLHPDIQQGDIKVHAVPSSCFMRRSAGFSSNILVHPLSAILHISPSAYPPHCCQCALTAYTLNYRLAEALEMDEGGGGAADAGGADSYYGGYEDEKMRQVNNFAVLGVRQNLSQDNSSDTAASLADQQTVYSATRVGVTAE